MANLGLIVYNNKMLTSQLSYIIRDILSKYGKFDLQTKLSLLGQLYESNYRYFRDYGSSYADKIDYDIFDGPPDPVIWNRLQEAIVDDLKVLYGEQSILDGALEEAKNYHQAQNDFVIRSAARLKNEVSIFTAAKNTSPGRVTWFAGDDFHDTTKVDFANTTATVSVGTVELERDGRKRIDSDIAVALSDKFVDLSSHPSIKEVFDKLFGPVVAGTLTGNGFPGNYHEAYLRPNKAGESDYRTSISLAGIQSGWKVEFTGADNTHANISEIVDGNPSTWFEYEVCNMPDSDKQLAQWYGLDMVWTDPQGASQRVPWYAFSDGSGTSLVAAELPPPTTFQSAQYGSEGRTFNKDKYEEKGSTVDTSLTSYISNLGGVPVANMAQGNNRTPVTGAPRQGGTLRLVVKGVLLKEEVMDSITITPKVIGGKRPNAIIVEVKAEKGDRWIKAIPLTGREALIYRKTGDVSSIEKSIISTLVDLADPVGSIEVNSDDGVNIWVLPKPMPVKAIRVVIEQPQTYDTEIGHVVWGVKITTKETKSHSPGWLSGLLGFDRAYSETSTRVEEKRIPGGDLSLEGIYATSAAVKQGALWVAIGMAASLLIPITGMIGGAIGTASLAMFAGSAMLPGAATTGLASVGTAIAGALIIGALISGFFGTDSTSVERQTEVIGPFVERFKNGWRYAIGVRDIVGTVTSYKEVSEFQSINFISPFDIKRVYLMVGENIPHTKYAPSFNTKTPWIDYYISMDGGVKWYPISPKGRGREGVPQVYYINFDAGAKSSSYGYIQTEPVEVSGKVIREAHYIKFKAVIKRPADAAAFSPKLYGYRLILDGTT